MVVRVPKTYPGVLRRLRAISTNVRDYLDGFANLFLVGRNGMHRYNNQDHSMLTAMTAVEESSPAAPTRPPIWAVNIDDEYHEEKQA